MLKIRREDDTTWTLHKSKPEKNGQHIKRHLSKALLKSGFSRPDIWSEDQTS